jgi:hypothetical protein
VVVQVKHEGGITSVVLHPPFRVHNYLPCRLVLHVLPQGEANADIHQDKHYLSILPGKSEALLNKAPEVSQYLVVRVLDFDYSRPEQIGGVGAGFKNLVNFTLLNRDNEELWMTGWVTKPAGPNSIVRYDIVIYTAFWVIDRTGLRLGFCENPRGRLSRAKARQGSRRSAAETTGGLLLMDLQVGDTPMNQILPGWECRFLFFIWCLFRCLSLMWGGAGSPGDESECGALCGYPGGQRESGVHGRGCGLPGPAAQAAAQAVHLAAQPGPGVHGP